MPKLKKFLKGNRRALLWMIASIATTIGVYLLALWVISFDTEFTDDTASLMIAALPAVIFSLFMNAIHAQGRQYYFLNVAVLFVATLIGTGATASQGGVIANDPAFFDPTFVVNTAALTVSLIVALLTAPQRPEEVVVQQPVREVVARRSPRVLGALVLGLMLGAFIRIL